jgi:hypothetical protein
VVWICLYFSIYWEYSSQLANIFQRGWNHQPYIIFYGKVISWMDWCSINAGRITSGFRSDVCCLSPVFVCWLLLLETTIAPLASGEKKNYLSTMIADCFCLNVLNDMIVLAVKSCSLYYKYTTLYI